VKKNNWRVILTTALPSGRTLSLEQYRGTGEDALGSDPSQDFHVIETFRRGGRYSLTARDSLVDAYDHYKHWLDEAMKPIKEDFYDEESA
jgi:hypothetical protein